MTDSDCNGFIDGGTDATAGIEHALRRQLAGRRMRRGCFRGSSTGGSLLGRLIAPSLLDAFGGEGQRGAMVRAPRSAPTTRAAQLQLPSSTLPAAGQCFQGSPRPAARVAAAAAGRSLTPGPLSRLLPAGHHRPSLHHCPGHLRRRVPGPAAGVHMVSWWARHALEARAELAYPSAIAAAQLPHVRCRN